jgi:LysR family glycine cleavage system transcriptional activator
MPSTPRLPLATLPAFLEAARLQNLRATAEQLHLTHSAISQQMRHLEQQLGFDLFERRGRSLVLNPAGAALQRAVQAALTTLDEGVRAATLAAEGKTETVRLTVLPSFAQRWLLPRMARWRERHPDISIEIHASQELVDLSREGYHAGVRVGSGRWRGLETERLIDSPLIAVASPARSARVKFGDHGALAAEPLLGSNEQWTRFLSLCGCRLRGKTVAEFNDAGLMLQAAEQDLGIALARELLAADALRAGRLVRLSPLSLDDPESATTWLVYPPQHAEWPALMALRLWLHDEMAASRAALAEEGVRPAGP